MCFLLIGAESWAQCLSLPNTFTEQLNQADKIVEGRVVGQESFLGPNGNVFTQNSLEVYRVFKGEAELTQSVVTEGGVFGDVMQLVTPSIQLQIGDYGVLVLEADEQRNSLLMASNFISINETNNAVLGSKNFTER
ncbi:MAG: hypothetical protein ACPG5W_10405, partial [Flavobacteriales bacterium]